MIKPKRSWLVILIMVLGLTLSITGCGYKAPPFYEEKTA